VDRFRELEDKDGLASTLNNLGVTIEALGDYDAAYACYTESLQVAEELGSKYSLAYTANSLAHLMLVKGDFVSSQKYYRQSLDMSTEIGEKRVLAYCFEGLAMVEVACGNVERAARLLASAESLRESIGARLSVDEDAEYDQAVNNARAKLSEEAFTAAWAQGRAMTMEQAIQYALEKTDV
jgi:tetratricopeptide (TPR) repeat protein